MIVSSPVAVNLLFRDLSWHFHHHAEWLSLPQESGFASLSPSSDQQCTAVYHPPTLLQHLYKGPVTNNEIRSESIEKHTEVMKLKKMSFPLQSYKNVSIRRKYIIWKETWF